MRLNSNQKGNLLFYNVYKKLFRWLNRQNNHPLATHYSFGLGKRSCIGKELAFIELKIILSHVLQHFCVLPASIPMVRSLFITVNLFV
jgi:cytochrome P450